jgi:hypothetical protein
MEWEGRLIVMEKGPLALGNPILAQSSVSTPLMFVQLPPRGGHGTQATQRTRNAMNSDMNVRHTTLSAGDNLTNV